MTRRKEREQAFCLIFEKCFRDETVEEILELGETVREFELTDYIKNTFCGTVEKFDEIDSLFSPFLKNWTVDRLPKTNLALLRLGVYEMKYNDEIPVSVTINEIVELAKIYADEKDVAFINGVLGSVAGKESIS